LKNDISKHIQKHLIAFLFGLLTLTIFFNENKVGQTVLVDSGAVWEYLDDGLNQEDFWYAIDFDDSWKF